MGTTYNFEATSQWCRQQLFTQKSRNLENVPPTYAALKEHVKRGNIEVFCQNLALFLILIFQICQIGGGWIGFLGMVAILDHFIRSTSIATFYKLIQCARGYA